MKRCLMIAMIMVLGVSAHLWADDIEIYGTVTTVALEPNVLIVFDSSGSMGTVDVPGEVYNPATIYIGSYSTDAVYERYWDRWSRSYRWRIFADSVDDIACDSIKTGLLNSGNAEGRIRSDYSCGGYVYRRLRLGNYMNYDESGAGALRSRIEVAKEVITNLINNTDGVRFGLMRFNYDEGGRVLADCGSDKTTLINQIASIDANGWTPLAETLAEAGLYYAGMQSWFNDGVSYTSPIQERCQKNYIIVMTDGEPTEDRSLKLTSENYINNDIIGDYDNDHTGNEYVDPYNSSDYLDDVAQYLYERDCHPTMGDGTAFDRQNIVTYTIGFKVSHPLLQDTAINGGGEYFTADNISDLALAFEQILTSISEENAVFVSPVVPISRMNRTYAGDKIYLGFFKPQQSGRWLGNIKRYGLGSDGSIYDATGSPATTANGMIKDNALSYWTTLGNDGPDVSKGGAAEVLNLLIESAASRNVYTYTGTQALLTDSSNAFVSTNFAITNDDLNVSTDAARQSLIDSVVDGELGSIVHSEPVVIHYDDPDGDPDTNDAKTMIYVGANDGMLHCFDDDDGSEVWGFIPPEHLGRLNLLNNDDHDYFVDSSPVAFDVGDQRILFVGERRGGESYTALDITSYNEPRRLYSIGPDILDLYPADGSNDYESLGQSWGKPERSVIATGATITITSTPVCSVEITVNVADAFLLPGGYDNNQDLETPADEDSVGRAVFAVNATTGTLINSLNFNAKTHQDLGMTHSIVDVSGFDHDGDGIVSRVYVGDLGGNIFAFKDDQIEYYCDDTVSAMVVDGIWEAKKLFSASADGVQRKILYAPDAVAEDFGEMIFFGTGDRSDPGETDVVNRFYAIKHDWAAAGGLTESDLVDVTDDLIQLGDETEKETVKTELENAKGWFIRLENPGEKVVASPRVFGGVVYFTTYTPSSDLSADPDDPCEVSTVRGVARLYAVNYKTGASVHNFSTETELDHTGEVVELGKKDRFLALGTAIPSAPVIAILEGGARLFVGVEGGIVSLPTVETPGMYSYYWHQIF